MSSVAELKELCERLEAARDEALNNSEAALQAAKKANKQKGRAESAFEKTHAAYVKAQQELQDQEDEIEDLKSQLKDATEQIGDLTHAKRVSEQEIKALSRKRYRAACLPKLADKLADKKQQRAVLSNSAAIRTLANRMADNYIVAQPADLAGPSRRRPSTSAAAGPSSAAADPSSAAAGPASMASDDDDEDPLPLGHRMQPPPPGRSPLSKLTGLPLKWNALTRCYEEDTEASLKKKREEKM